MMLEAIKYIDVIFIYNEETPLEAITTCIPDMLVKGGDYANQVIVGAAEVKQNGWKVVTIPIVDKYSTTKIVNKVVDVYTNKKS